MGKCYLTSSGVHGYTFVYIHSWPVDPIYSCYGCGGIVAEVPEVAQVSSNSVVKSLQQY